MIYGVTGMWGANKLGIIKYRIKNVKIFLIAIIWLFILDVYLADYRSMAMTLGLKDSFAILPHVQNDFYFNKIMHDFFCRYSLYVRRRTLCSA